MDHEPRRVLVNHLSCPRDTVPEPLQPFFVTDVSFSGITCAFIHLQGGKVATKGA